MVWCSITSVATKHAAIPRTWNLCHNQRTYAASLPLAQSRNGECCSVHHLPGQLPRCVTEIARRKPQGFNPGGEAGFWWLEPEVLPRVVHAKDVYNTCMDRNASPGKKKITFVYPLELSERMRKRAAEHGRSLNGEIEWALREYIARHDRQSSEK